MYCFIWLLNTGLTVVYVASHSVYVGIDCSSEIKVDENGHIPEINSPRYSKLSVFLAHLSQRLIGELKGYSWSGVRPSSVDVRQSVVNNFKRLLLRNRWADQSQILCGASLGRGNNILFAASGSHDQDGRHAHIW